jgi:hypothetical protein
MNNPLIVLGAIGALLLLILLHDGARKITALLVLAAICFGLGWFWPKPARSLRTVEASSPPPCASSF